jgi:hypothetical protein
LKTNPNQLLLLVKKSYPNAPYSPKNIHGLLCQSFVAPVADEMKRLGVDIFSHWMRSGLRLPEASAPLEGVTYLAIEIKI